MRKASSAADGTPRGWVLVAIAQQKARRGAGFRGGLFTNCSVMRSRRDAGRPPVGFCLEKS